MPKPKKERNPKTSRSKTASCAEVQKTEQLIEDYLTAFDKGQMDTDEAEDWRRRASDYAQALKGRKITANVEWRGVGMTKETGTITGVFGDTIHFVFDVGRRFGNVGG